MARIGFKSLPGWVRVTLWGTLAIVLAAILVPAGLRTFMDGLRGDLDPDVIAAQEHTRKVELEQAKAKTRIAELESSLRSADKILSGTGTKEVPAAVILREIPRCALEDGSTQKLCVWDGRNQGNKVGLIVVNIDHGKIAFFPQTNSWKVF